MRTARRGTARQSETNKQISGMVCVNCLGASRALPDTQKLPELASLLNTTNTGLHRTGKYASFGPKADFSRKLKTIFCTVQLCLINNCLWDTMELQVSLLSLTSILQFFKSSILRVCHQSTNKLTKSNSQLPLESVNKDYSVLSDKTNYRTAF